MSHFYVRPIINKLHVSNSFVYRNSFRRRNKIEPKQAKKNEKLQVFDFHWLNKPEKILNIGCVTTGIFCWINYMYHPILGLLPKKTKSRKVSLRLPELCSRRIFLSLSLSKRFISMKTNNTKNLSSFFSIPPSPPLALFSRIDVFPGKRKKNPLYYAINPWQIIQMYVCRRKNFLARLLSLSSLLREQNKI